MADDTLSKALREHLARLGKKGGEAARGDKKRQTPAHYKRITKLAAAARARKAKAKG